ncbi:DUF262 domain-containing protein [Paenibacillus alkalitolerans]|uniref:DUF262 domain-containing protein n=1 Tax=Paenibacillus alkalitolerans TaxID=2799335 RepID=UPI0018F795FF|nr:DUF262 domain-containing protein [Paenibacillus alkalitolerans]
MQFKFSRNTLTVKEIYDDFKDQKLIIDNSYQRRKVWMTKDNVRLIETILLNWIIPEIFLWPADINPDTGNTITHIVDGQQRINAIIDFISGEYKLQERYLLTPVKDRIEFTNMTFSELSPELKKHIWMYSMSIVNIDRNCTIDDIKRMFYRLNLTDYSLNEQEKRNSLDNDFGNTSKELANDEFWEKHKVFSASDVRRMKDVEYCSGIIILAREGIVDQTTSKKINETYDDLKFDYPDKKENIQLISEAMDIIDKFTNNDTFSFISKKSQMYTMFSVSIDLLENKIKVTNEMTEKFSLFVRIYNKFKNELDLFINDTHCTQVYEGIKKYKLASSEGINKLGNRVIRFEIIKKYCVESDRKIYDALIKLEEKINDFSPTIIHEVDHEEVDNDDELH